MRIRKNAKVSVLTHAYDAGLLTEMPSPHVCELNQSPWDIVVFSADALSGHFQAGEEHESFYTPDASCFDDSSVGAADESSAVASVKMSVEASGSDDSSEMMRDHHQWGSGIIAREEEKVVVKLMSDSIEVKAKEKEEEVEERSLCNRVGGRGWHCWREAAPNHSLCRHHLAQVQARAPVLRHHSSRTKKPPHPNPHSNRNEFYYYSGFGPRWGKRRRGGGGGMESISVDNNHAAADTSTAVRTVTGKEEEEEVGGGGGSSEDDEMEFVDEDYDDEDEGVRKRPRKPVKARSLKSLM